MRHTFRFILLLILTLTTISAHAAEPDTGAERPNIIVILVDDMGFSDIGPWGSEIPTPGLNRLAAGGVRFSQFYNTGRCCPTRASLLTGLYSHQAGIGWMTQDQQQPGYRGQLTENCATIAQLLQTAGYYTFMTGKWHVGFEHGVTPWNRGFERSLNLPAGGLHYSNQTGPKGGTKLFLNGSEISRDDPQFNPPWYGADLWTDQGLRFLDDAAAAGKPFFWYLAHCAPHFPCMAPEETISRFRGRYKAGWDSLREQRYAKQIELGLISREWQLEPRPEQIPAWDSLSAEEQDRYDHMMAIYAAMIVEVDRNITKLMDALQERDQLQNTLILFMSDNGGNAEAGISGKYVGDNPGDPHSDVFIGRCWAHLNNTPFREYKHYNHEGGTATPLIAHWPAAVSPAPGPDGWITTPAHLIDIMPTCLEMAGTDYPAELSGNALTPLPGQSLLPLLTGKGEFRDRTLYWEHEGNAAIREGDRKLVRKGFNGVWELFDLSQDRTEQHNLADQFPAEKDQLLADWREWARSAQVLPRPQDESNGKKKSVRKNAAKKAPTN